MLFKQFHHLAPVERNVHLKVFVLFVIAIWHIFVRFLYVVLFLIYSKKQGYFFFLDCDTWKSDVKAKVTTNNYFLGSLIMAYCYTTHCII